MQEKVIELYNKYGNGGMVAKELNITTYKVYKILRQNNIEPKKIGGKEKVSAKEICELYKNGLSTYDIAKKFNMKAASIIERIQNHGAKYGTTLRNKKEAMELCDHTKIKQSDEQAVIEHFLAGEPAVSIAARYNVYKDAVYRILKKHNISTRPNTRGANSGMWKGGITPLHKQIRNSAKYTNFRDELFQERNFTCQITGERGGRLNIHHIKPFKDVFKEFLNLHQEETGQDILFELALKYEPFWDKDNIIVLSEDIHKKIHSNEDISVI